MKNIFKPFLMAATVASLFFVSSCTKTCDPGFEGSDCKTEVRAKVIGTYNVPENCTVTGSASYSVLVTKSSTEVTKVLIAPFGGYTGVTGTLVLDGSSLTGENFTTAGGAGFSNITGTVSADGTTISFSYQVSIGGQTETCNGTWVKQ